MINPETTAFVFPGQGSQFVGMGYELAEVSIAAKQTYEEADDCLGFKLSKMCWVGSEEVLTDTINAQPALLVCSIALLRALFEKVGEFKPAFMAGHSLGEITALVATGSLRFADAVLLVRKRGALMKTAGECSPGCMAVLLDAKESLSAEVCAEARSITGGVVQVANDNCPGQIVISGDLPTLNLALKIAKTRGVKRAAKLPVSIASHSPLMQSAREKFTHMLEEITITSPIVPIIGNVNAAPLLHPNDIRAELSAQLVSPVRWTDIVHYLISQGVTTFVELGPLDVLTSMMPWFKANVTGVSIGTSDAIAKLQV